MPRPDAMNPGAAGRAGTDSAEADGAVEARAAGDAEVEGGEVRDVAEAARAAGIAGWGSLARLLDAGTAASCQE
ncbi:hypothetical protein [Arthrobacter sp. ISL-5]|uniref:hypothetical protein n=1 Tax=Arthrobacter sp. ISL-5 TaxID=2819111 RepID=UPI001BEBEE53|nr:hypothetical protein [Arthrobacter sp. ISL-5]MBT2553999.1 hypothetical protein [Arthrobacter sp. ISL-5]